jgi:hypothetical protein
MTTTAAETTTTNGRTYTAFTSYGTRYDTLAAITARLATLAVEDTLNGPSDDRTTERITLVEHLMRFANAHGSARPAATVRQALTTAQYAYGHPGVPVLSVLEEIEIATTHTQ